MKYKFIEMKKPLAFDVYCGKKIVIPAGAKNVKIAFRQSHMFRHDDIKGDVRMNVYLYKGIIYHA